MSDATGDSRVREQIAPRGVLRAGINLGNVLLVTGRTGSGDPVGVSPDMARAVAARMGVAVRYVTFASPGQVADAAGQDVWDIALIANESERARTVAFSPAYVEIGATYLVPAGSPVRSIEEVDRPGVRIAVSARSAYDLHLARTLQHAELVRGEGLDGALGVFTSQRLDALAGLRPALIENASSIPGARVLEGEFSTVRQAIGILPEHGAAADFLAGFVREARADGTVQGLVDRHGMTGRLQVGAD